MALNTVTGKAEKKSPTTDSKLESTFLQTISNRGASNITSDFDRQFTGVEVPGFDLPSTYEPYLNLNEYNILRQDINKVRAENQGNFRQFLYGTAGGVGKGALHAIGGAANLLDFEAHLNHIQGINDTEQNWLSELTSSGAEAIGKAMPIYQEDPSKVFDFSDGASYFKAWEGLIDSAVQFAAPGGVITKGIGAAMKGGKIMQWVTQLATKSPTLAKIVANTPAAVVMNQFEGHIMAYETAQDVKKQLREARERGDLNITVEDIEDKAQDAFNQTLISNLAFIPIQGLQTMGLVKGQGFTRNLLKDRSTIANRFKNFGSSLIAPNADNLIVQGLGEAAEEITQGVMSGEAKYQALKGTGLEKGSENFVQRIKEYATDSQTLLEGAMGFFGGGVQRVMMEGITGQYSKSAKEEYQKQYNEQQAFLERMKDFAQGKTLLSVKEQVEKENLIKEGRLVEADMVERAAFQRVVTEASRMGTMEMVENTLNDIIQGKAVENQDELLGEEAKAKASEYLREAKEIEKMWLRHIDSPLHIDLFNNRLNSKYHAKSLDEVNNEISRLTSEIKADVIRRVEPTLPSTKRGETYSYDLNEVLTSATNDIKESFKQQARVKRDTRGNEFNTLVEGIKGSEDFFRLLELQEIKEDLVTELNSLDAEFKEMNTAKGYQKKVKENALKQRKANEIHELYKTHTKELSTVTPSKGAKVLDSNGNVFSVEGFVSKTNKVLAADSKGKKVEFTPEEFKAKFQNPVTGTYTTFIGKDIVEERKKEAALKNKKPDTTTPEGKANQASQKSKDTPTNKNIKRDNVEIGNGESNTSTKAEVKIKEEGEINSLKGNSLAWSSFNNIGTENRPNTDEARNIAEYLEDPNNKLVNTRVRLEKVTTEEPTEEGAIQKVTASLLDASGNVITHKGTPIVLYVRTQGNLRDNLGTLLDKHPAIYTTITDKTPGYVQFQKGVTPVKLDQALSMPAKDMEFGVQLLGEFVQGEKTLEGVNNFIAIKEEGQVVVKVPAANGKPFPLRLTINTISTAEAEVIYELYKALILKATMANKVSDFADVMASLKKLEDSGIALKDFLNLEQATFAQVFSVLTHQGNPDSEFPLYSKNRVLYYGKTGKPGIGSITKETFESTDPVVQEAAKAHFINWLTNYKVKNVNWRLVDNPKYKQYLVDNVVSTKALYNQNGIVFAQPMIVVDPNIQISSQPEISQESKFDKVELVPDEIVLESEEIGGDLNASSSAVINDLLGVPSISAPLETIQAEQLETASKVPSNLKAQIEDLGSGYTDKQKAMALEILTNDTEFWNKLSSYPESMQAMMVETKIEGTLERTC